MEAAAAALPEATLLHFACHAGLGTTDPLANHLLLAGDAPWYGDAIADARTESVRLVVLSACGTADVGHEHALEGSASPAPSTWPTCPGSSRPCGPPETASEPS